MINPAKYSLELSHHEKFLELLSHPHLNPMILGIFDAEFLWWGGTCTSHFRWTPFTNANIPLTILLILGKY